MRCRSAERLHQSPSSWLRAFSRNTPLRTIQGDNVYEPQGRAMFWQQGASYAPPTEYGVVVLTLRVALTGFLNFLSRLNATV